MKDSKDTTDHVLKYVASLLNPGSGAVYRQLLDRHSSSIASGGLIANRGFALDPPHTEASRARFEQELKDASEQGPVIVWDFPSIIESLGEKMPGCGNAGGNGEFFKMLSETTRIAQENEGGIHYIRDTRTVSEQGIIGQEGVVSNCNRESNPSTIAVIFSLPKDHGLPSGGSQGDYGAIQELLQNNPHAQNVRDVAMTLCSLADKCNYRMIALYRTEEMLTSYIGYGSCWGDRFMHMNKTGRRPTEERLEQTMRHFHEALGSSPSSSLCVVVADYGSGKTTISEALKSKTSLPELSDTVAVVSASSYCDGELQKYLRNLETRVLIVDEATILNSQQLEMLNNNESGKRVLLLYPNTRAVQPEIVAMSQPKHGIHGLLDRVLRPRSSAPVTWVGAEVPAREKQQAISM